MTDEKSVRLDARFSMTAFVAVAATALFVLSSPGAMTLLLAYVIVVFAVVGGGRRNIVRHLTRLAPVVALIVVLNGALVSGDALLSVAGHAFLTAQGLRAGVFFSLRFLVLYFAAVVFMAVTPPIEIARGMYAIFRPVSDKLANHAAFYGFLVTSFLPLFTDEFERIRLAQSFRGGDFKGGLGRRVASVRLLVVPIVLSAIHRSEQLAAVVELRGLRDRMGAALPAAPPGVLDVVYALATTAVLVTAIWVFDTGAI